MALKLPKDTGIMICGHGSRNQNAAKEFATLSQGLKERYPQYAIEYGYLEFCNPVIHSGLDRLKERGIKRVLAVPGMLFAAGHAKNDIPSVLNTYQAANPEMSIEYGSELGVDLKMIKAASQRIEEAIVEADKGEAVSLHETLLMVVGRGASDPDANSNVSKIMRMLWEGMGFGWAETCYSGVTFPLVESGLEHAAKLGYKRIIVFPYFLFTGVLIKRIFSYTDDVASRHPNIEFVKAGYLSNHPLVLDTFEDRLQDILDGRAVMNCQMCKYRDQVLGFEDQIGLPQESHHHHVEGIGGGLEDCPCKGDCDAACREEAFCKEHNLPWTPLHDHSSDHDHSHEHSHESSHGHSHDHNHEHDSHNDGHHHHPYPHADHPLGPKSMIKPADKK